jgi:membrane protein DedA with SNARE-associated domain
MQAFFHWLVANIADLGYLGIVVLMAVESSVVPLPSELVIPPAGYLAARGEMSLPLVVVAGAVGSVAGALINYALAAFVGLPVLRRYGKFLLISSRSLDRAQTFFDRHGEISTLIGRLVPVVRHLISIPAGICRMRLSHFVAFTAIGAGVWCAVLAYIGWLLGKHEQALQEAAVQAYTHRALVWVLIAAAIVLAAYVYWNRTRRVPSRAAAGNATAGRADAGPDGRAADERA